MIALGVLSPHGRWSNQRSGHAYVLVRAPNELSTGNSQQRCNFAHPFGLLSRLPVETAVACGSKNCGPRKVTDVMPCGLKAAAVIGQATGLQVVSANGSQPFLATRRAVASKPGASASARGTNPT